MTKCFENLFLDKYIIASFYNSLKTKGFVILAGLSGTGKTKIFEEFVKCFKKEKWIVIEKKDTVEKLLKVDGKNIREKPGKDITIEELIEAINQADEVNNNQKYYIKIGKYYVNKSNGKVYEKLFKIGSSKGINFTQILQEIIPKFNLGFTDDINSLESLNLNKEKKLAIKEFPIKLNNHIFFPIRPDFKDSKSLLGFYNPLIKEYQKTPLLELIIDASKNYIEKGKNADPFFVLFDEMNLARVEYYFADFLSVLEAKRFESKEEAQENDSFNEFLKSISGNCYNAICDINENNYKFTSQSIKLHNDDNLKDIPKELFLPPNLYFVGTVNIDETTHMFSPKVLDRAFTIEFDVDSFEKYFDNFLKNLSCEKGKNSRSNGGNNICDFTDIKKDFTNDGEFVVIDKYKIKKFLDENDENNAFLKKLDDINKVLRKHNLHFGYRVFDEIIMFLYNSENSKCKFKNLNEAFDLAIKMKVLPKFHGTRQKLEEPIIELLEELDDNIKDFIKDLKDGNIKITIPEITSDNKLKIDNKEIETKFPHTVKKLLEMLYKLKTQGFASFM